MAERLELSKLEALAMEITDSDDSDYGDGSEAAAVQTTEDSALSRLEALAKEISDSESDSDPEVGLAVTEAQTPLSSIIQDIEAAAHTSTIVLEELDGEEEDAAEYVVEKAEEEDAPEETSADPATKVGQLQLEQLEFVGMVSETDADMVEPQDDTMEDDDDEEDVAESDDESSSDEEMPKAYESASDLCDNYLDHLNNMLRCLSAELERNLRRQEEIDEQVFEVQSCQATRSIVIRSQHVSVSKKSLTVFGYPYFKDQNLFRPPANPDTLAKKFNKELDPWIENPRPFTKEDKKHLKVYVREDAVRRRLAPVEAELDLLEERSRQTAREEGGELEARREALGRRAEEIRKLPDNVLFMDRFHRDFDWDRISVTNFNSSHTPAECELQWRNLVHPDINRGVWSPEEDGLLRRLAEATGGQDWDSIARELATGRTAHACFVRYMTRHCVAVNNRKWERSEDDRLRRLVAHCRINDFIPWAKVSFYMERRTKEQCYQRYVYSLKDSIRRGAFTDAEDMILIIGKELYNKDWAKISEMLPARTPVQLHCRWNSFLKCEFRAWTAEEDNRLLELVREHGIKNWVAVAEDLGGHRTRGQVRQRFQQIYQTFKRDPTANLANMRYSEDAGIAKKRQDQIFEKLSACYAEWREAVRSGEGGRTQVAVGRYASSGHIQLRDGEVVSNRDLCSFIRHIQSFLPAPEPPRPLAPLLKRSLRGLPGREEELARRPMVPRTRNMASRGRAKRPRRTGPPRAPAPPRPRARRGEPGGRKVAFHAVSSIDREIANFFRPTWQVEQRAGLAPPAGEKEAGMVGQAARGLGRTLGFRPDWDRLDSALERLEPREAALLRRYREQEAEAGPCPAGPGQVAPRAAVQRTYSRRGRGGQVKAARSAASTPVPPTAPAPPGAGEEVVSLLAPSRATLLGVRGLQLLGPALRARAAGQGEPPVDVQADERLVRRLVKLFFWPVKMSATPPPQQERLFDASDEEGEVVTEEGGAGPAKIDGEAPGPGPGQGTGQGPGPVLQGRGLHGLFRTRNIQPEPEL